MPDIEDALIGVVDTSVRIGSYRHTLDRAMVLSGKEFNCVIAAIATIRLLLRVSTSSVCGVVTSVMLPM